MSNSKRTTSMKGKVTLPKKELYILLCGANTIGCRDKKSDAVEFNEWFDRTLKEPLVDIKGDVELNYDKQPKTTKE